MPSPSRKTHTHTSPAMGVRRTRYHWRVSPSMFSNDCTVYDSVQRACCACEFVRLLPKIHASSTPAPAAARFPSLVACFPHTLGTISRCRWGGPSALVGANLLVEYRARFGHDRLRRGARHLGDV